jgi:hypothetical protein
LAQKKLEDDIRRKEKVKVAKRVGRLARLLLARKCLGLYAASCFLKI